MAKILSVVDLDQQNQKIINLGKGDSETDAARLLDVTEISAEVVGEHYTDTVKPAIDKAVSDSKTSILEDAETKAKELIAEGIDNAKPGIMDDVNDLLEEAKEGIVGEVKDAVLAEQKTVGVGAGMTLVETDSAITLGLKPAPGGGITITSEGISLTDTGGGGGQPGEVVAKFKVAQAIPANSIINITGDGTEATIRLADRNNLIEGHGLVLADYAVDEIANVYLSGFVSLDQLPAGFTKVVGPVFLGESGEISDQASPAVKLGNQKVLSQEIGYLTGAGTQVSLSFRAPVILS